MKNSAKLLPVSVIIALRNSADIIGKTLDSVIKQRYPIKEIIVVDNASTDKSREIVSKYRKKKYPMPIRLICQKKNKGVGASFNLGTSQSKAEYVVFMHADAVLPTRNELRLLTKPIMADSKVIASASNIILPMDIWLDYPFWEKCLLARSAGKSISAFNGKFDCLKKSTFESIKGFDEINFRRGDQGVGGEDADLTVRLMKVGSIVKTEAKVVHLHSLDKDFSFSDWIVNRRLLARSYGRYLRIQRKNLIKGSYILLVKPLLVILSIILPFPISTGLLFLFAFASLGRMYLTVDALKDWRIVLLPFITVFLIYYETFWLAHSYLFIPKQKV